MSEPFIGEIRAVAFTFAPTGWAMCNGQLLSIAQNTALFSLLGTTYGGNGTTTFALPDLRGRVAVHIGGGLVEGQSGGEEAHTLTTNEMPTHSHAIRAGDHQTTNRPLGAVAARGGDYTTTPTATTMAPTANTGGSQPHNNMQPYTVLNYCIALVGIFPSRP